MPEESLKILLAAIYIYIHIFINIFIYLYIKNLFNIYLYLRVCNLLISLLSLYDSYILLLVLTMWARETNLLDYNIKLMNGYKYLFNNNLQSN